MQYLVLIYEAEKRFANGYPESEFAEYGAFGKNTPAQSSPGCRSNPLELPRQYACAMAKS